YASSADRFGIGPVPVIINVNSRQCVLCGCNVFVQFQRSQCAGFGFGEEITAGAQAEDPLIEIRPRKVCVGLSVTGVNSNCLSIKVSAPSQVNRGNLLEKIVCLENKFIGLGIDPDWPAREQQLRINYLLDLGGDILGYLAL